MEEKIFLLDEEGEWKLSQCKYDKDRCCYCMTYSILSQDRTHYNCGKCGAVK